MRERQPSLAETLLETGALLDGRYRLEGLVHRSPSATIHLATHRNGSTAWLKLPSSPADGELVAREAQIANAIGSPLIVRDDGTTREGVPYLVLDPPDAESVRTLLTRARAGAGAGAGGRAPLAHVLTAGDALARVVGSLHAMGFATAGFDDEGVLVFGNADVALLDLHALVAATPEAVAADVKCLRGVLSSLVSEVADTSANPSSRALFDGVLAAGYPEVAALQAAWRAAAPEPIQVPGRARGGGLGEIPSAPMLPAHDTPMSSSLDKEPPREPEASIIGYLRSGRGPSMPPPSSLSREEAVMYDPLSRLAEMPRLVQAASQGKKPEARSPARRLVIGGAFIAAPITAFAVLVLAIAWSWSEPGTSSHHAAAAAAELAAPVTATPTTSPVVWAMPAPITPSGSPGGAGTAPPSDELELNTMLTTDGAPPDRDVYLDGKSVGKTPLHVSVPCGGHTLQMVAGAPKQKVELPCGGERVVRYDAQGHWSLK